ncbi:MAG: PAS domain-containing protein [Planctomycetaceae bacterium]|nr:PAS domain-containing protein [Planctomycetaceae bacterium]
MRSSVVPRPHVTRLTDSGFRKGGRVPNLQWLHSRLFWTIAGPAIAAVLITGLTTALAAPFWLTVTAILLIVTALAAWMQRRVISPLESLVRTVERHRTGSGSESGRTVQAFGLGELVEAVDDWNRQVSDRFSELEHQTAKHTRTDQLLQTVLGTISEGVVVVDSAQRILFANAAARPLLDFATRDVLDQPLWEVARSPYVQELLQPVLATGGQKRTEFELPRTRSVVAATATALPAKPIPGAVLMLQNVTELRRLEKLRQDFVSNVSHELKTPLTSIQAYTDTLLEGAVDDPQYNREFLGRIMEQSERLYDLILDLLRLAKIETQQEAFDIRAVELRGPIEDCVASHVAVARSKSLELTHEGCSEPIFVQADARELRTILDNLLDNAIHYTPVGGRVVVRVARDEAFARLQVEDTGVGIARDQQARIFERFYRADRARNRDRGGTGLGLAIVKHLAQLFGGSVEVVSELGRGSTFTVSLLLADTVHPEPEQAAATS